MSPHLLAFYAALSGALAAEPEVSPDAPPVTHAADPIVVEDRTPEVLREELDARLGELGYDDARRRGDYTYYGHGKGWYPQIRVHDEGFVVLHRSRGAKIYLKMMGDWRKAKSKDGALVVAIEEELSAWRWAMIEAHMEARYAMIPGMLEATWRDGAQMEGWQGALDTPDQRRAAILHFWASRADTPEGERVREIVEDFLLFAVQDSPWPLTAAEIKAAEAACRCAGLFQRAGLPDPEPGGSPGE